VLSLPGAVRQEILAGENLGDGRLHGVVFMGDRYYVSGEGERGVRYIYVLDRDGRLVSRFAQPPMFGRGMLGLEWDGEWIWGACNDSLVALDLEGRQVRTFRTPVLGQASSLAYEPEAAVFWVAEEALGGDMARFDREGRWLGYVRNFPRTSIFGLAWNSSDADSCPLYFLTDRPPTGRGLYKFNPANGNVMLVQSLAGLPDGRLHGACITREYDHYRGLVLVTMVSDSSNFSTDAIEVVELEPNDQWLRIDPTSGVIPGGEEMRISAAIQTVEPGKWAFGAGDYLAKILLQATGRIEQYEVELLVTVMPPNKVGGDQAQPSEDGLTALYPQPFNAVLTVEYRLAKAGEVKLVLIDLNGREIEVIDTGRRVAGEHSMSVDMPGLPSGVYLVRLETQVGVVVRKVVCVK